MTLAITASEICTLLRSIENGWVQLEAIHEPQSVYAGSVDYLASNGWRLTVFNDCNQWDCLERIESPDGRRVEYSEMSQQAQDIAEYTPSSTVAWERYRMPGHMTFRCVICGADFKYRKDNVFLCENHR